MHFGPYEQSPLPLQVPHAGESVPHAVLEFGYLHVPVVSQVPQHEGSPVALHGLVQQ